MSRTRTFAFTLNNYTSEHLEALKVFAETHCVRLVVGGEVAPTTGTPHLQGFARLKNPVTFKFWTKKFPGIHVEAARLSDAVNISYCSKSGNTLIDHGVDQPPVRTYSNRVEESLAVMDAIDGGDGFGQVRKRHRAFCFFHAGLVKGYIKDNEKYGPSSECLNATHSIDPLLYSPASEEACKILEDI